MINFMNKAYMDSIIKFGQFVRYQRKKNGWTQLELSMKVFGSLEQQELWW